MVDNPPPPTLQAPGTVSARSRSLFDRRIGIIVIALGILIAAAIASAQVVTGSGETYSADGRSTDMAFFAAEETLTLSATSTDDIFAAGGNMTIVGAGADHLFAAAGDITVSDIAVEDLIMAGGTIDLVSGTIADDVIIAGGELTIAEAVRIGGSAMIAASELDIATPIGGDLYAAGETIDLRTDVARNANLYAETVRIGPGVTIAGDLRYRAKTLDLDPAATVTGTTTRLTSEDKPDAFERYGKRTAAATALFGVTFFLGMLLLVGVVALALPGLVVDGAAMMRTRPWMTLGIGALCVAVAPVALIFLMVTVIGLPLALTLFAIYLATAPFAIAVTAYFIGFTILSRFAQDAGTGIGTRLAATAIGIGVLVLLGLLPLVGGFVWLAAYLLGIGAVFVRGGQALAGRRRLRVDAPVMPTLSSTPAKA